jgi:hypothetical protein
MVHERRDRSRGGQNDEGAQGPLKDTRHKRQAARLGTIVIAM